jgi:prepilin-type N-terminal cleavage/methylation domain-containing protein
VKLVSKSNEERGFTLFEIVVSLSILAVLFGIGVPITSRMYQGFLATLSTRQVAGVLRSASNHALSDVDGVSHGVYVQGSATVIFQGSSYATRDPDFDKKTELFSEVYSGPTEIVFSRISGFPNATGTWTFVRAGASSTVSVNEVGAIMYE